MSAVVLARLREVFLDPGAAPRSVARAADRTAPTTLGVLATPDQAAAAGAALGLAAATAAQAPCAVVCHWAVETPGHGPSGKRRAAVPFGDAGAAVPFGDLSAAGPSGAASIDEPSGAVRAAGPSTSAPAVGAARRLAARLDARGLDVAARGRLVTVRLPASGTLARAAAERAMAAADVPVVLVIAGPRSAAFDPLLAGLDRLVVVPSTDAPAVLARLAVEAAARLGRATSVLRLPSSGAATHRLTVSCGLLLSPSLRTAAEAALRGGDDG